ncbi:MAG: AraC family transcriptional regulator, partial [Planctomycetaceae bacterium]
QRQHAFFQDLESPLMLLELFEFLPNVYLYVKDREGKFLRVNRFACQILGVACEREVVGKNDFDFFPPAIASQYVEEDHRVLASGSPLLDQVWLVPGGDGFPRWYLCNKIPLRNLAGEICGLAGIKRPYEHSVAAATGYSRLLKVVEFVTERFCEPMEVSDMAAHVGLSTSQLQREFSRLFGISPIRYLREIRIGVARRLLETSDYSLAKIAADCGFYDQSHFSRQFKESTGLAPLAYRKRYQPTRSTRQ